MPSVQGIEPLHLARRFFLKYRLYHSAADLP